MEQDPEPLPKKPYKLTDLSAEERAFLERYRQMSPAEQAAVHALLDFSLDIRYLQHVPKPEDVDAAFARRLLEPGVWDALTPDVQSNFIAKVRGIASKRIGGM